MGTFSNRNARRIDCWSISQKSKVWEWLVRFNLSTFRAQSKSNLSISSWREIGILRLSTITKQAYSQSNRGVDQCMRLVCVDKLRNTWTRVQIGRETMVNYSMARPGWARTRSTITSSLPCPNQPRWEEKTKISIHWTHLTNMKTKKMKTNFNFFFLWIIFI